MAKPPAFTLEYSSYGGPELGEGLHERQWRLEIDGASGSVLLEKHRSDADAAGEPIGLFRARWARERLSALLDLAHRVRLSELEPRGGAGPGASLLTLKLEEGGAQVERVFASGDIASLERLEPLLDELNRALGAMNDAPVAAIRAEVAYSPRERRFELIVANIGGEPVCVGDPRLVARGGETEWTGVRVAELPEERPGYTSPPLQWVRLPLAEPPPGAAPSVVLAPGEKLTIRAAAWASARRGVRCIAQAVFVDYGGPREVHGCRRVRGAAFSAPVELVVE